MTELQESSVRAGARMNRTNWDNKLREIEAAYRFKRGYKLLYCPWETLDHHKLVFLSLNPGARTPHGSDPIEQAISDERGNSYEVEQFNSRSPISDQFLRLCEFMAVAPAEVLTGVVALSSPGRRCTGAWRMHELDRRDMVRSRWGKTTSAYTTLPSSVAQVNRVYRATQSNVL